MEPRPHRKVGLYERLSVISGGGRPVRLGTSLDFQTRVPPKYRIAGCSSAWLERRFRGSEAAGSNPVTLTLQRNPAMAPRRPLDIPLSKQRPANLPTHDSSGRKLPFTFKAAPGSMAKKDHKPKGKEIRVIIQDGNLKPELTTFRDMKIAHQFINASNTNRHINRTVTLEFGNGKKVRLKRGQTVKP